MDDLHLPDTWSPEDDALLRGALLSLRDDVLAQPLPEPAFVRARGDRPRRRRILAVTAAVAAAVIIVGAVGFRGLTREDAAPPPIPAEPTPTLASNSPTATTTPTTPTATPSTSTTRTTSTSRPRSSSTPASTRVVAAPPSPKSIPTSSPKGSSTFSCPARARSVAVSGVPSAAAASARALMSLASTCDEDALIARFEADRKTLSFGGGSAQEWLSLPENVDRYTTLTTVLSLPPGPEGAEGYVQWPKPPETDADWQALVDAGLITQENIAQMKEYGGYTGWRVVVSGSTGQVTAYVAGD